MHTSSIEHFTLISSGFPDLDSLQLSKLYNLEQLDISLSPRYRKVDLTNILDNLGKLQISCSTIKLSDVNTFELSIPQYLVKSDHDILLTKTIPN